ncbi:uncharacterized protein P884DRAFT_45866 [Thermothelomyces heterothallicus CBS 202.75]|uniref:uncharacterized protein n=1 Tax=Thermothelomyces heterothallicus CBS 202.75 TaxID=1149848 RepID=UPI003743F7F7
MLVLSAFLLHLYQHASAHLRTPISHPLFTWLRLRQKIPLGRTHRVPSQSGIAHGRLAVLGGRVCFVFLLGLPTGCSDSNRQLLHTTKLPGHVSFSSATSH